MEDSLASHSASLSTSYSSHPDWPSLPTTSHQTSVSTSRLPHPHGIPTSIFLQLATCNKPVLWLPQHLGLSCQETWATQAATCKVQPSSTVAAAVFSSYLRTTPLWRHGWPWLHPPRENCLLCSTHGWHSLETIAGRVAESQLGGGSFGEVRGKVEGAPQQ